MLSEHISIQAILFFILYGVTGVVSLLAALYLWFYRGNAIAPGVTPPVRLRRWAACFFSVSVLDHVWWLLFCISYGDIRSMDDLFHSVGYWAIVMLDYVAMLTTLAGTLLSMLQDRRRPVWPVFVAMIPIVALGGGFMVSPDILLHQIGVAYIVLLYVLFAVYMVFAVRHYGRWLNDNYADLENKKVWLSQVVTFACLLLFILYTFIDINTTLLMFLMHFSELVLFVLLLWRVETLPQLESLTPNPSSKERGAYSSSAENSADKGNHSHLLGRGVGGETPVTIDIKQIERLLKERCEDKQLYLKHDLSLQDLAQKVGTNRTYLSQYFSRQSITYNTYINNLRVNHFIKCYEEGIAASQPISAQELAYESGFSSYRTFSRAFTQRMGKSVTDWMRQSAE